jgi:hypothetical protein
MRSLSGGFRRFDHGKHDQDKRDKTDRDRCRDGAREERIHGPSHADAVTMMPATIGKCR